MLSVERSAGADFYQWGMTLEMSDGSQQRMRAAGQSEMKQLLATLSVNCIPSASCVGEGGSSPPKERRLVKEGWMGKKAESRGLTGGHAFHNRWLVLEVESEADEEGNLVTTASLSYFRSKAEGGGETKGTQIPLSKGTEHRIVLQTPKRDWELGCPSEATAHEWAEVLSEWMGLPKSPGLDADEEEEEFRWVYVVLADRTLLQFCDETRTDELRRLQLDDRTAVSLYLDEAEYAHAFHVSPEGSVESWVCCPPEPDETPRWMAALTA
ncbi:MAG: hypothetical protein SGPRY_012713 [Prymnesium sp.]